jgi:hypothetical protein
MVVFAAIETATHSLGDGGLNAFVVGSAVIFYVLYWRFAKRLCCPACGKSVLHAVLFVPYAKHCPHCAADWTRPLDGH